MSAKHTPGPFAKQPGPHPATTTYLVAPGNQVVATVIERGGSDGANARLFAAAPQMYALCEAAVQAMEATHPPDLGWVTAMHKLISEIEEKDDES